MFSSEYGPVDHRPDTARVGVRRIGALIALVVGLCVLGAFSVDPMLRMASLSAAVVLALLMLRDVFHTVLARGRVSRQVSQIKYLMKNDIVAAVLTDSLGRVTWENDACEHLSSIPRLDDVTVAQLLADHVSAPEHTLRRIRLAADQSGYSSETVVGLDGVVRLSLMLFPGGDLWRIELKDGEKNDADLGMPSILLGRNGVILSMNEAARVLVGTRAKSSSALFRDDMVPDDGAVPLMTAKGEVLVRVRKRDTGIGRTRLVLTPLDESEPQESARLDELPLPVVRFSANGTVLEANQLALHLLGNDVAKGRKLRDLLEGLQRSVDEIVEQAAVDGAVHGPEILRLRDNEKEIYIQMTLKRVMQNVSVSLVAILSDATELKSMEAQFVQGQKMQAIGQLAGGVAHDFNNLLTAISGHCDLMLLRHDQGEQDYADLIQIHQNANRAAALVTQLLAFSRKQTLQPECLDLRDTLSDLTHLLNRLVGEKVSLMLSHDPVLRPIRADRRQLEQVIMNLVVNARDAMPDGGQISIETESMTLREPLMRDRATVPEGDYVLVRVRDQGMGIHPDTVQKIFEPFFTTKRTGDGTGLGLSTAYGIVKQTGGYIFVDSQLGQGTCFTLMFAAQVPQARSTPEVIAPGPHPTHEQYEGVVLLVEDEAPVRAFASRALTMRGFEVLEASSAEEALELLEDETLKVDVFVTDVVMPGQDGPTWVRKALKQRPDVRVVFVSGYTEGALDGDSGNIPGSVFLPKPFSLGDLTSTVQNQLQ